jgi:hypothetical protein
VSRGPVPELPKIFDLLDCQAIARQVKQAIQKHGAMTIRQDEAVSIKPMRVTRVVAKVIVPEHLGDIRHAHRHTGMTGIRGLDGVHAQGSYRIGQVSPGWLAGNCRSAD